MDMPSQMIDHINGIKSDNRISSLRLVSRSENAQNQKTAMSNSKSGLLGVSKNGNKWKSQIRVDGRQSYLGTFETAESAHLAYLKAKRLMHVCCTI